MLNSSWHLWGLFLSCFLIPWWKKILSAPVGFRTCFYSPNARGAGQPGGSWRWGNGHCPLQREGGSGQILQRTAGMRTRFQTWFTVPGSTGQKTRPQENSSRCGSKRRQHSALLGSCVCHHRRRPPQLHTNPRAKQSALTAEQKLQAKRMQKL